MMSIYSKIQALSKSVEDFNIKNKEDLESFRLQYVSRKGPLMTLFACMKTVAVAEKKKVGALLNTLKSSAQKKFSEAKNILYTPSSPHEVIADYTLPVADDLGACHPLSIITEKMVQVLQNIGFNLAEGPEIDTDWYNFTALNFPPQHPARDMQDTFFLSKDFLLRTHTSSVQIRMMEKNQLPLRIITPGRVFRKEAISARTHCMFHQMEALYVAKEVNFLQLKATLLYFVQNMFGSQTKMRLRPSYFPFTEPSAELDIACQVCLGKGCALCKNTGWVEIGGAGLVDPQVLLHCKIDPQKYRGFAFGMGIERIAMLLYRIDDIRLFTENDLQFLKQFKHVSF